MAKTKKPIDDDPRWTCDLRPAPGDLRIVQAFLNTASPRLAADPQSPLALARTLGRWGLLAPGVGLEDGDLQVLLQVRGALRSLLLHGDAVSDTAVERLDRAMTGALLRVRFVSGGRIELEPAAAGLDGIDAALARLSGAVVRAKFDGDWSRMKMCVGATCQAVFFDFAKNGRTKWCSTGCCSRGTSRTYRKRNLQRLRELDRHQAMFRRF